MSFSFCLYAARKSLSPVLDMVVKRMSPEEMEKELKGAETATELNILHPKEGLGGAEGQ